MSDYATFLLAKAQANNDAGFTPTWMPDTLFPYQRDLTEWAVRMGRAAHFLDCGLGKTRMQLTWAQNVHLHTGKPVLVAAPLAVGYQTVKEAAAIGVEAAVSRLGNVTAPITVTNYERLEHFDTTAFGGLVCDESSAIKAFDGKRRAEVTEFARTHRYRLLATATAAPNDHTELGTSSEALGYLGHMDMLGRFFVNDQRTAGTGRFHGAQVKWRFKGHAEEAFWRWVASWARAMRTPSDLGYDDTGFVLPALIERQHMVEPRSGPDDGGLFDVPVVGFQDERAELRRTVTERCEAAAALLQGDDRAVAWCHLNDEGDLLTRLIPGAVQVAGSESVDAKEEKLAAFSAGGIRVLVTKPNIAGWGLNWQHCHRMTFFPSHSYEQFYQAKRRMWRFGQQSPVTVDIITTPGGGNALANLQRKADAADRMFNALVRHMRDALAIRIPDGFDTPMGVPAWL